MEFLRVREKTYTKCRGRKLVLTYIGSEESYHVCEESNLEKPRFRRTKLTSFGK